MVCSDCFFYSAQVHETMGSTAHSRLDPVTSIISFENVSKDLPIGQILQRYFLNLGSVFPYDSLVCVNLTQN